MLCCLGCVVAGVEDGFVSRLTCGVAHILHAGVAAVKGGVHKVGVLIAAAVNIECVNTVFAENLNEALAVLKRSAAGDAMIHGDAVNNGHIVARASLDGLQDLQRKARTVFIAAAVFVFTLVPQRGEELINDISDVAVHLDRVIAGVRGDLSGQLPGLHDLFDLFDGEWTAENLGIEHRGNCGRGERNAAALTGVRVAAGAA